MSNAVTCIALLRGINVGKAKRIAMADLRELVESLGCRDVRTLLNSGNVVFTIDAVRAAGIARRIEAGIQKKLAVASRVTVMSADDLAEIVASNPLLKIADNPSRLMITVLSDPADQMKLTALVRQSWKPDSLALGTRVAYAWCASGILQSNLFDALGRALQDGATSRNWATILKLHALASKHAAT